MKEHSHFQDDPGDSSEHLDDRFNPVMEGGHTPVAIAMGRPTASYLPVPETWTESMDQDLIRYEERVIHFRQVNNLLNKANLAPDQHPTFRQTSKVFPNTKMVFEMLPNYRTVAFKMAYDMGKDIGERYGDLGKDMVKDVWHDVMRGGNQK